jgi:hypothetical protein
MSASRQPSGRAHQRDEREKFMKTLSLVFGLLFFSQFANAQAVDVSTRFPGYSPTVLESDAQAADLFNGMINDFKEFNILLLQFGTQCTQRAETWAYELNKIHEVKSEKVFVFYTHAFKRYYQQIHHSNFKWWFHVAPYVLVKNAQGVAEERVMDKVFATKPQSMKDWTDLFIESKEACIENVPFANFEGDVSGSGASYNANAHCYIVRAPMFDMYPADIDNRERGLRPQMDFSIDQVLFGAKALNNRAKKDYLKRVGLDQ